jgi:hypothetical protein
VLPYQRFTFFAINGVVLAWLLKVLVRDPSTNAAGLLGVVVVGFLLLYALYFALVVRYSHQQGPALRGDRVKFLLFALLPFLALWCFTV